MIYLDNAATTLIKPPAVVHAVTKALRTASNPGRGAHASAMAAAELVYDCREAAAALFHVPDPSRVVFTLNATHALNIAIRSLASRGSRVVISGFEHNAVLRPLHALGAELRIAGRRLFDPQGMLEDFRALLPGADLAVCTHVSNVFGYILPVEEIAALCREQGVPLIVDASQSAGLLELDQQRLGAAFIAMPGHKGLFGPAGTGILLCGGDGKPLLYGGTGTNSASPEMPDFLPDRLEAGTCNVPGIAGLREGIRFVSDRGPAAILAHEQRLLRRLAERLAAIPSLRLCILSVSEHCINGHGQRELLREPRRTWDRGSRRPALCAARARESGDLDGRDGPHQPVSLRRRGADRPLLRRHRRDPSSLREIQRISFAFLPRMIYNKVI